MITAQTPTPREDGFTLIELLVVIAVFTVLTGALMLIRPSSTNQTQVRNAAYEVALFLREAQAYGSGVRNQGASITVSYNYGVEIEHGNPTIRLFAIETTATGNRYVNESTTPTVSTLNLSSQQMVIERSCVRVGAQWKCAPSGGTPPPIQTLVVLFKQPSLNAHTFGFTGAGISSTGAEAFICIRHQQATTPVARIYAHPTGLIEVVSAANCNP